MKQLGIAGMLALALLSCERKEEGAAEKAKDPASRERAPAGESGGSRSPDATANKPTKSAERPAETKKKIPVAEPVTDKPGFVKSPFSGDIIDVRGIPAGTLVADPTFPAEEKKHFRVPDMPDEDEAAAAQELAEELAKENAPVAEVVPGKPGFLYSPHDRKIIDATGLAPGSVVKDPGSPPDAPRYLKIPDGLPEKLEGVDDP